MPAESVNDVVVLIPGILGTKLERGDETVWGLGHALLNFWRLARKLTGDLALRDDAFDPNVRERGIDDGVVPRSLLAVPGVVPGFWRTGGYNVLAERLRKSNLNFLVVEFPYDWRQSNRVSAQRLHDAVYPIIRERRATYPQARLQLVGHSMGGLVARWFAEVLDTEHHTRRVITIGTPYSGAAKALAVLANGDVRIGPKRLDLGELTRSLPSVAELLPTYPCVGSDPATLAALSDPLVRVPGLPDVVRAHAVAFHAELAQAKQRNGGDSPSYRPIIGTGQATDEWASIADDRVVPHPVECVDDRGDGTVPRQSASPPDEGEDHAGWSSGRHAAFHESDAVWDSVFGALTARARRAAMSTGDQISLEAPDYIEYLDSPPVLEIDVESAQGNKRLALQVTLMDAEGQPVGRPEPARADPERPGHYRAHLTLPGEGLFHYTVASRGRGDGITAVGDVVWCAAGNEDGDV